MECPVSWRVSIQRPQRLSADTRQLPCMNLLKASWRAESKQQHPAGAKPWRNSLRLLGGRQPSLVRTKPLSGQGAHSVEADLCLVTAAVTLGASAGASGAEALALRPCLVPTLLPNVRQRRSPALVQIDAMARSMLAPSCDHLPEEDQRGFAAFCKNSARVMAITSPVPARPKARRGTLVLPFP